MPNNERAEQGRWRRRLRRAAKIAGISLGALVLLLFLVWLLRWPLFGGWIRRTIEQQAGKALSAEVRIGRASGSLLTSIELHNLQITPRAGSPLAERSSVGRLRVDYSPWRLLSAATGQAQLADWVGAVQGVRVEDTNVRVALPEDDKEPARPWDEYVQQTLDVVDALPQPPRMRLRNVNVTVGDLFETGRLDLDVVPDARGFTLSADLPDDFLQGLLKDVLPDSLRRIELRKDLEAGLQLSVAGAEQSRQLRLSLSPEGADGQREVELETAGGLTARGQLGPEGEEVRPDKLSLQLKLDDLPLGQALNRYNVQGLETGAAQVTAQVDLFLRREYLAITIQASLPGRTTFDAGAFGGPAADLEVAVDTRLQMLVHAEGPIDALQALGQNKLEPVLAEWVIKPVELTAEDVEALGLVLDRFSAEGGLVDKQVKLDSVVLRRGEDRVEVTSATIRPFGDELALTADMDLDIRSAAEYLEPFTEAVTRLGPVRGKARVTLVGDAVKGALRLGPGGFGMKNGEELPGPIDWQQLIAEAVFTSGTLRVERLQIEGGPYGRDYELSAELRAQPNNVWQVKQLVFDSGPDHLEASGTVGPDGLRLDFQFKAQWPLPYGPMFAVAADGYGLSGTADAEGTVTVTPDSWRVEGQLSTQNLEVAGLVFQGARTDVLIGGPIGGDPDEPTVVGQFANLRGWSNELGFYLNGSYFLRVQEDVYMALTPDDLMFMAQPLEVQGSIEARTQDGTLEVAPVDLDWRGVKAQVEASLGDPLTAGVQVPAVETERLQQALIEGFPNTAAFLKGVGTGGVLGLRGSYRLENDRSTIQAELRGRRLATGDLALGDLDLQGQLQFPAPDAGMRLQAVGALGGSTARTEFEVDLPLTEVQPEAPVKLKLTSRGRIGDLTDAYPLPDVTLPELLEADGNSARPRPSALPRAFAGMGVGILSSLWDQAAVEVDMRGTAGAPVIDGAVQLVPPLAARQQAYGGTKMAFHYEDGLLRMPPVTLTTGYVDLSAHARMPVRFSLAPQPSVQLPEQGDLDAALALEIRRLRDLLRTTTRLLSPYDPHGAIRLRVAASGALPDPELEALFAVQGASVDLPSPLASVRDVDLKVEYTGKTAHINATGNIGFAPFRIDGRINPDATPLVDLRVRGQNVLLMDSPDVRVRADLDVTARGTLDRLDVSGDAALPLALIYRELFAGGGGGGEEIEEPAVTDAADPLAFGVDLPLAAGGGLALDLAEGLDWVHLDLNVRNTGELRIENTFVGMLLQADIHVGGTLQTVALTGEVRVVSGEIRVFAGTFILLEHLAMIIPDRPGVGPIVNVRGRINVGTMRVYVQALGSLSAPSVILVSEPPRPQDQLLSILAFGRTRGATAGAEAAGEQIGGQFVRVGQKFLTDRLPRAQPSEGFLDALAFEAGEEEAVQAVEPVPWSGDIGYVERGSVLRAEYVINDRLSIRSERDELGGVVTDLQYSFSWGADDERLIPLTVEFESDWQPPLTPKGGEAPWPLPAGEPGDYTVNFRGVERLRESVLQDAIAPTIDRLGDNAWTWTYATDAAFRIRRVYLERGYGIAQVTPALESGNAWFFVSEGPPLALGEVEFVGNSSISDEVLRENLATPTIGFEEADFSFRVLDAQQNSIAATYQARGFLNVKVHEPQTFITDDRSQVDVVYRITEGKQFRLQSVKWTGVPPGDEEMLNALVDAFGGDEDILGRPMPSDLPDRLASQARSFYRDGGRPTTRVIATQQVDQQKGTVALVMEVGLGKLIRAVEVDIAGEDRTDESFIHRLADLPVNRLIQVSEMREAERRLIRTGVFRTVQVFPETAAPSRPLPPGVEPGEVVDEPPARFASATLQVEDQDWWETALANYQIRVKEMDPYEIRARAGYGTFEGPRVGADVSLRNLVGKADTLWLSGTYSSRGYKAETDYTIPYAWSNWTSFSLGAFLEQQERPRFTSSTYGLLPRVSFNLYDSHVYRLGVRVQEVETSDVDPDVPPGDVLNFQFIAPFAGATWDWRDSPRLPRTGGVVNLRIEWTSEDLGSDISYLRGNASTTGYLPVGERITLASSVKGGRIVPLEKTDTIPISLRFFAGGATTVRGFEEQELKPKDAEEPTGGEVFVAAQNELRYLFVESLYGAAFIDVGNVYPDWPSANLDELRYGVGGGVRYFTPAGALVLDVAYNPEHQDDEPATVVYFSFGMPF